MPEEQHHCDLCQGKHAESQMQTFQLWENGKCQHLQFGRDCARTMYYNAADADHLTVQLRAAMNQITNLTSMFEERTENHG